MDAHAKRTPPTPPPCTPYAQRFCSLRVSLTFNLGSAPPTTGPRWGQGSRSDLELLHPSLSLPRSNRAKRQPLRWPPSLSGNPHSIKKCIFVIDPVLSSNLAVSEAAIAHPHGTVVSPSSQCPWPTRQYLWPQHKTMPVAIALDNTCGHSTRQYLWLHH